MLKTKTAVDDQQPLRPHVNLIRVRARTDIAASPPITARGEGFPHPHDRANLYNDGRLKSRHRETVSTRDNADDRCSPRLLRPLPSTPLAELHRDSTPISSTR
ncbi:hypothetical protein J6590_090182 [Homalodisca vitripennis]|nr:hypothetical protein J6590_090182 [Homalodisca vitripennis]